jgi:hypothetical protein
MDRRTGSCEVDQAASVPNSCPVSKSQWIEWRDFWLPSDAASATRVLVEAWERAATERVEVACRGGRGRTQLAIARGRLIL